MDILGNDYRGGIRLFHPVIQRLYRLLVKRNDKHTVGYRSYPDDVPAVSESGLQTTAEGIFQCKNTDGITGTELDYRPNFNVLTGYLFSARLSGIYGRGHSHRPCKMYCNGACLE